MRKKIIYIFVFFTICILIYQCLSVFLPNINKTFGEYLNKKHNKNYDQQSLHGDKSIQEEISFFKRIENLLSFSWYSFSSSSTLSSKSEDKEKKIILFWTSWFKKSWLVRFGGEGLNLVGGGCPETRCIFTHDKTLLREASALLFQSQRVSEYQLPSYRHHDQRWLWVHVEPPTTSQKSLAEFAGPQGLSHLFNWTMTYHPDSDIMEPYGALMPIIHKDNYSRDDATETIDITRNLESANPSVIAASSRAAIIDTKSDLYKKYLLLLQRSPSVEELMESNWEPNLEWDPGKKFTWSYLATRRTRLVAWVSSHCPTMSKREEYVDQLQNYVTVHAYGTCGDLRCGSRQDHRDNRCWRQILARKYLFYLSFENSICDGYITEKLWRPMAYGLVPIVFGGAHYSQFLPPRSFINALEYSPEDLGRLLKDLQESPDFYIQYHLWRVFWRATSRPPLCELCKRVHEDDSNQVKSDISKWWYRVGNCSNPARWPSDSL